MMKRATVLLDFWLYSRVFSRLAHWIDWRFHYSPYQQAYRVLQLAQAMQIAGSAFTCWRIPWVSPLMLLVVVTLFYTFRSNYRSLEACQRQLERDPSTIVFEQARWIVQWIVPPARLILLAAGLWLLLLMVVPAVTFGNWDSLLNGWVAVNGVAMWIWPASAAAAPTQREKRFGLCLGWCRRQIELCCPACVTAAIVEVTP